ncbi:MAG: YceI family protein [Pontibacterium sp.]
MNAKLISGLTLAGLLIAAPVQAADYTIDTKGAHASINFRVNHLGTSWLLGRFNDFSGNFSYDAANPAAAKVNVNINTASIDSNHAERDKHLRDADFLDVKQYPTASFTSSSFTEMGDGKALLKGDLTLHGTTKAIEITVSKVGEGKDPWGGYRAGFEGTTEIRMKDFGINYNLGPLAESVYLDLNVEGVRK